jgi:23S rRNA (guanine745-N1)-methyltransferase
MQSSMVATKWLICPVCTAPLAERDGSAACAQGHSFDFARSGYLNLTRAGGGRSREGDTRPMLAAREEFLAAGHYELIADAVAERVAAAVADQGAAADAGPPEGDGGPSPFVVEIGSGTGYYLAAAIARLRKRGQLAATGLGIDLAKDAADLAARRHRDLGFVAADVQERIPVADGSVDAALSVFAPRPAAELARVIRPGGTLVVAFATPRHLAALRARLGLMDVHAGKLETLRGRLAPDFEPAGEELLERDLVLDRTAAANAVLMGPNARHAVDLTALDDGGADALSVRVAAFRRASSV